MVRLVYLVSFSPSVFVLLPPHIAELVFKFSLDLIVLLLLFKNSFEELLEDNFVVNFVATLESFIGHHLQLDVILEHAQTCHLLDHNFLLFMHEVAVCIIVS